MTPKHTRFAILLITITLAACGRREEPAAFDAAAAKAPPAPSVAAPLPASALHVRWSPPNLANSLTAGALVPVTVTFTNIGDRIWPDRNTADPKEKNGGYAVRLCYSLIPVGKQVAGSQHAGERVDLMKPVAPGESATLAFEIRVPAKPGDYVFFGELVQELVVWFADQGADVLTIPVKVAPAAAGAAPSNTPKVRPPN